MKITQLHIYPIKSLRPITLSSATLCAQGLEYDRRYILLRPAPDGKHDSMFVGNQPEMAHFHCKLQPPETFRVEYRPSPLSVQSFIDIPFEPVRDSLKRIDITIHTVPDFPAYQMPDEINIWFSKCLGYSVVLAIMGDGLGADVRNEKTQAWLPSIKSALPIKNPAIKFSDGAAILLTTEASLNALHQRLEGEGAVMEKLRPNIVVDGTTEWDEDYWGEIQFPRSESKVILTSNCARCMSINVDLDKGKMGDGPSGSLLKRMMRDRRIDKGNKWTPIMGRYGFPTSSGVISVGDEVVVSVRIQEHTTFNGIMPRLASFEEKRT